MENDKSKNVKQDKKTTEGEARERKEETKLPGRLALDLELTLGRNLSRRPSSLVVSPAESTGSPSRSGASTPGTENLGMVEFMWDEVKCQSVARKEPKNPEMGQSEDKGTRNGKDKSGAVPKLMLNQLSKLQKISSLTDDSPGKRKVADTSMETDVGINPYKKRESLEAANLKEAMNAVTRIGGKINKVVKNLYHPKTELVDLVAKLNKWAAVFQKESLKAWMEAHKYEPVEKAMIDVDTQADVERETEINKRKATTRNIGCQIDFTSKDNKSNNKNEEKKDMVCQTETRSREGNRLETLQGIDTLEKWVAAEKKEWSGEVYTNTSVLVGNPLVDVKDSIVKAVLVEPTDAAMDLSIQRLYRNRFPELASVKEEWAVLE
jgi:SH3-like domain-containing protein